MEDTEDMEDIKDMADMADMEDMEDMADMEDIEDIKYTKDIKVTENSRVNYDMVVAILKTNIETGHCVLLLQIYLLYNHITLIIKRTSHFKTPYLHPKISAWFR